MRPLEEYHRLNPGRRYEVVWEWEIDGHEVAYGYREVDWPNGETKRHPAVFCECEVTCTIIDGHVNVGWGGQCGPKQKVYELGAAGARDRYSAEWDEMSHEDAIVNILGRVANQEWLGQHDRHINPREIANLLTDMPEPPDTGEVMDDLRRMAAADQIKTISNYWFFVDPDIPE